MSIPRGPLRAAASPWSSFVDMPVLRTLANPRFRLILAVLIGTGATARYGLLVIEGFRNMNDFRDAFLTAARQLWAGIDTYGPLTVTPANTFYLAGGRSIDSPVFLMLLWPWTVMPEDIGRIVWLVMESLALLGIVAIVYRGMGRPTLPEALVVGAALVFWPPIGNSIHEGQISVFLGFLLALALLAHRERHPTIGGISLGLAISMKLAPALVLPYFAWRRDWRMCGWAMLTTATMSAATLALGWAHYWPGFIRNLGLISSGTANVLSQSINSVLLRAWRPELSGMPINSPGLGYRLVWLGAQVAVVGAIALIVRRMSVGDEPWAWLGYSLMVLLLPLVQPFAWEHHFAQAAMLLPVVGRLVGKGLLSARATLALAGIFVAEVLLTYPSFAATQGGAVVLNNKLLTDLVASLTADCVVAAALVLAALSTRAAISRDSQG